MNESRQHRRSIRLAHRASGISGAGVVGSYLPADYTPAEFEPEVFERSAYLEAVHNVAARLLRSERYRGIPAHTADDICQRTMIKVLRRVDHYRAAYPVPAVLAAVVVRSEVADHHMRDRVQRGHLARPRRDADGVAIDPVDLYIDEAHLDGAGAGDGAGRLDRMITAHGTLSYLMAQLDTDVVDADAMAATVRGLLERLGRDPEVTPLGLRMLVEVDSRGRSVTETAAGLGIRREHAQRHLGRARLAARRIAEGRLPAEGAQR